MGNTSTREVELRKAIIDHYLETGKGATVADIAKRLSLSEGAVRKSLAVVHGMPKGTHAQKESKERYSRDYPMFQVGYTTFYAYYPNLETLREIIVKDHPVALPAKAQA